MDIDFPLLETTRPPMYTFDKYVGKKPHNIWASYIEAYTKKMELFWTCLGAVECVLLKH